MNGAFSLAAVAGHRDIMEYLLVQREGIQLPDHDVITHIYRNVSIYTLIPIETRTEILALLAPRVPADVHREQQRGGERCT